MKPRHWLILIILLLSFALFPKPELSHTVPTETRVSQTVAPALTEVEEKPDVSRWQFSTVWGNESQPELRAFSLWIDSYLAASAAERATLESNGIALAKHRRRELLHLIQKHPKAAIASAVPAAARAQLPASILANLEQRVSSRGDLEVLGRSGAGGNAITRRASFANTSYTAHVFGERLAQRTTRNISLHGIALDGHLAVSESSLRAFEPGEQIPADKPVASDSCIVSGERPRAAAVAAESGDRVYWLCRGGHLAGAEGSVAEYEGLPTKAYAQNGPRRVLLMLVDFSDRPGGPGTTAAAQQALDNTANFLNENSVGQLTFPTRVVTSVLRVPQTSTAYRTNVRGDEILLSDARAAAVQAGYTPDTFDFDIVAFEHISLGDATGGQWSGQGYVGSKGSWIQGPLSAAVMVHELGHNLGLWHANLWQSPTIFGAGGTHLEYGNTFDAMGYAFEFPRKHYSANFKSLLGWLPSENIERVLDSGTYRIYAHDQNSLAPDRKYAVKIPVGIFAGGEIEDYWLDYRQLLSSRYPNTAAAPIIKWGNDAGSQSASRLLDTEPSTTTTDDAPLIPGRIFSDPERSLSIETIASGGTGPDAYVDLQIVLTAPPFTDLSDALDQPEWTWTTSVTAWTGQRNVTHDGVHAGQTGPINHGADTWVQTTVTGPGALSFWWKVSSEQGFDYLRLLRNDVLVTSISGDVDWQFRSIEIPTGTHRLRWSYRKDSGVSAGADRGWLDQISFDRSDRPPQITTHPAAFAAIETEQATFRVEASGTHPLTYQWRRDSVDLPDETNSVLVLTNLALAHAGDYSVFVANNFGNVTSSNATLTVVRPTPLPEALDTGLPFTTFGDRLWRGQTSVTADNIDAARTGPILDNQRTALQTVVRGPGALHYWRKVSCEPNYDTLNITLDGDYIEQLSGEQPWQRASINIPNGPHTVRWTYIKDSSGSAGQDAAWVDVIEFQRSDALAPTILAAPTPQSAFAAEGIAIFKATIQGSEPLACQWLKNGAPIEPRATIAGLNSPTLLIAAPRASDAGAYSLEVINQYGAASSTSAALKFIANRQTLPEALDTPARPWTTPEPSGWTYDPGIISSGAAARSGQIADVSQSWIETVATGPARLSFKWRVSSEANFDFLTLVLNGADQMEISGETQWATATLDLPEGEHTLRWRYRKDWNTATGSDAGYLDEVVITPLEQPTLTIENNFTLNLTNLHPPGAYTLETSPDLLNWSPLSTNYILAPTATTFSPAKGTPSEFLRIRIN